MKKILLLCVTVLLIGSFVDLQAQGVNDWSWSHPRPVGQTLRWCQMFDANTYYAVGYGGNFVKTTDGGTTWQTKALAIPFRQTSSTLYDAHFFNMNTGLASGYYRVFRTTDAGATWDTCNGLGTTYSYYKMSFINSNTGFVAGSSGRVFKTTNAGVDWTPTPDPTAGTSTKYSCYAINANIIMVGESSADIWRTTNGGANWYEGLYSGGSIYDINFINSTTGFACGSSTTLFKTTNAGANWTAWKTGLPSASYYDIDFGPAGAPTGMANQSFTGTTFPPTGWTRVSVSGANQWVRYTSLYHTSPASARISYQSTGGEDWLITPQINIGGSDSVVFYARKYYTSTYNPDSTIVRLSTTTSAIGSFTNVLGAYNTNSFGTTTWTRIALPVGMYAGNAYIAIQHKDTDGNGLLVDDISVGLNSPPPSPTVYVTGNPFAVYRSPSAPSTPSWDTLGFLSPTQPTTSTYYSTSLGGNGDSLFTVGAFGLMNKRNNISNRQSFRPDWTWMTSTTNAVGVMGNRVIIPTSYSAIWYTTTGGTSWDTMKVNTSYSGTLYSISTPSATNGWVCGSGGRTYKTTNGGVAWTEVTNPWTSTLYNVNFVNTTTGWIFGSSGRCYKTTNGGTSWTLQTTPGVTSTIYGSSFVNTNTGWFVGSSGKVSKTTDGGTNWVAQTSNYTSTLRNIDMINANTGWLVGYSGTIRKTTNGGTDWDTSHVPFATYASYYGVDFVDEWNGMVTGSYGQTLRTRDGGQNWIYELTGGNSQYGVKMTSTDSGWCSSSSGYIFKYVETLTGHNTYTHIVPEKYELNQNYPNPFNPTTTIQFALPKAGIVSLKVYDVSGRLVRTLFNNQELNEGTFNHIFDGSNVASGVYFYSLIVNDELIGTKKMVLIK